MRAKPYVGITGFKTRKEVRNTAAACLRNNFPNSKYDVMFGVLSSHKNLKDHSREGKQSPSISDLKCLLDEVPRWGLPMIHYYTPKKNTLDEQVKELFSLGHIYHSNLCRAVQLNVDWPPVEKVYQIMNAFPDMKIVLQLPKRSMEGLSTKEIAKQAGIYDRLVSYALIDPSGGKGEEFDLKYVIELMHALDETMPHTMIGNAGGYDAHTVKKKVPVIKGIYKKPFFIDTQGRVRTDDKKAIDSGETEAYLKACSEFFF